MAKNPNPNKANRHSLFLAASGYGKSTALRKNPLINKPRLIAWDPGYDHDLPRVKTMRAFVESLKRPGRIAVSLDRATPSAFNVFCKAIWAVLDGDHDTVIVVEEAAAVQMSVGKAQPDWGILVRESRKFGGIILATSQRSQEIDKTIVTQCHTVYVGCHALRDARLIGRDLDIDPDAIASLDVGQFYRKVLGPKPAELLDYRPKPAKKPAAKRKPAPKKSPENRAGS